MCKFSLLYIEGQNYKIICSKKEKTSFSKEVFNILSDIIEDYSL